MKSNDKSIGGRAYLVGRLRGAGLSRRDAVRILNRVLDEMKRSLKRGREVEFPYGKLRRVERYFGQRWYALNDWPANRQRYTVEWLMDEAGDRLLNPQEYVGIPERRGRRGARKSGK